MSRIRKEKKYILVDANNITRCKYEIKREAYCNDFINICHQDGYENMDSIFEKNNIPIEYRKLFLELKNNIPKIKLPKYEFEELLTREKFYADNIKKDKIFCHTNTIDIRKWMSFTTEEGFTNYTEILSFISNLNKLGLIDNYINSLNEFFRTNTKEKSYTLTKKH